MSALSILVYHFASWGEYTGIGWTTLDKVGVYGVALFYVISGLSLGVAYSRLRVSVPELAEFGVRRFFRLAPLYWLALAGNILVFGDRIAELRHAHPGLLALNLTLAFGVFAPGSSLVGGGWSIGNEVAFSGLVPFAIAALHRRRWAYWAMLIASLAMGAYFAFAFADPMPRYVWWMNHVFLFMAGVGLSLLIGRVSLTPRQGFAGLAALWLVFLALPLGSGQPYILTGWLRFVYSAVVVAICLVVALTRVNATGLTGTALGWLADSSYAVYLLHPITYWGLLALDGAAHPWLAAVLTFGAAHLSYRRLELPMIAAGKHVGRATARLLRGAHHHGAGNVMPSTAGVVAAASTEKAPETSSVTPGDTALLLTTRNAGASAGQ